MFVEHQIERRNSIAICNEAFKRTFDLFRRYTWNLDDALEENDEINPSVLGYIFEKYINQKEFGAYYTRPETTEYLCDRTINKLILDEVNAELKRQFESIEELLSRQAEGRNVAFEVSLCREFPLFQPKSTFSNFKAESN
ncbi:MAG: hypothetical protein HC895_19730 [Leptolyngbyaceae cyanobacterium SM1_3_5]|nr:hypothetical protein [Leptolyngbyaceae cyanobacterium SM1_3_5]